MNPPFHPPHTTNGYTMSFITTQYTYWLRIQPDQRAIIIRISEQWLQWVGTTHTNKTLYKGLQISMCVYMRICGSVWVLRVNCSMHVHLMQQNIVSHCHLAIQQRVIDVSGSATNYPLYTVERSSSSSSCSSVFPSFFLILCHSCPICLSVLLCVFF